MLFLANTLSPVMWRTLGLLFVGNAIIGLIEGAVIARAFRFPPVRTILLLIVANYCSMVIGVFLFGLGENRSPIPDALFEMPLHHAGAVLWICVAISFVVSVIVEWPFCCVAARLAKATARRALLAVLVANAVSCPLLILLFSDSTNTIGDDVEVVALQEVVPEALDATVYFIGDDGAAYTIDLDGSNLTELRDVAATHRHDVLGWRPPPDDEPGSWQLVLDGPDREEVLLEQPQGRCEAFRSDYSGEVTGDGWSLGTSGVADLRSPDSRDWMCRPRGNWGIEFGQESTGEESRITFDTPFVSWWGRCITILPSDVAVFELGRQVCVLSMRSGRIAFLARGQGPVVLLHAEGTAE